MIIYTKSGREVDLNAPHPDMFCIQDIAHSLSMLCRFTGHTSRFYSVAEHSVIGAEFISDEFVREFLLHDAAEAYVNDLAAPLKARLADYQVIHNRVDACIRSKFGLPEEHSPEVKEVDMRMLATERAQLMPFAPEWDCLAGYEPYPIDILEGVDRYILIQKIIEGVEG